jgi:hypothetical protein
MSKIVFGEIDWNAADVGSQGEKKNLYMRLEQGENVVRVMGNPIQYYVHWVQAPDGSKKKVNSPVESPTLVARLEDAGFRRQSKWLIKVLDREDNDFKVMEVGSQIFNGIKALYNNDKWGKVTNYDISVVRGPKGSQPLYNVTPNPKEKLDSSFKDKYAQFNTDVNIEKLIAPASAEKVCEIMGWKASDYSSQTTADSAGEEDFDFDFS